jgi:hypothetical protein
VKGVIEVFRVEYLRNPTIQGIQRFMEIDECHGLRGMLGRIGCVHWRGQRCAYAWNRIYTHGDHGVPTIILEESSFARSWYMACLFLVLLDPTMISTCLTNQICLSSI